MVVKKDNIERIIDEKEYKKYKKLGFQPLDKQEQKHIPDTKKLSDMSVAELKDLAKEKGLEDVASLNKPELLKVLSEL